MKRRKYPWIILSFIIVVVLIAGFARSKGDTQAEESEKPLPKIELVRIAEIQNSSALVRGIGEIESLEQVDLKSQLSGKVRTVHVELGQEVVAGQLLVELETNDLDAQLAQASASIGRMQAAVDQRYAGATVQEIEQTRANVTAAQAGLAQAEAQRDQVISQTNSAIESAQIAVASARSNLSNTSDTTNQGLDSSIQFALDASRSAIVSAQSGLFKLTDYQYQYFNCNNEHLCNSIADQKELAMKLLLGARDAGRWNNEAVAGASGGVKAEVERLLAVASPSEAEVLSLVNNTYTAVDAVRVALGTLRGGFGTYLAQGSFSGEEADVDGARGQIEGALASLTSAKLNIENASLGQGTGSDGAGFALEQAEQALKSARAQAVTSLSSAEAMVNIQRSALNQAQSRLDLVLAEPRSVDVAGLRAGVGEAQAAYSLIAANRDKAFIRAPFSGSIASLFVDVGELISPSQTTVVIVNENGLQVQVFVNEKDRRLISQGAAVVVNGDINGLVTHISPSIDAQTKKIEVLIALQDPQNITIGEFVDVEIEMNQDETGRFFLPFKSIKTTTDKNFIFTVNEEKIIEAHEIQLGRIIGDTVEVHNGLSDDWFILANVRGRRPGEQVEVIGE